MTTTANTLPLPADAPPLRRGEDGAVRIGNSRISLDLVVQQYENVSFPEAVETLAEPLDDEPGIREAGRERYRFYRDRGYPLESHQIGA